MPDDLLHSRWRGQPGRLEVWYTTLTDPVTGTGVWLHQELVAPSDGSPAFLHGWVCVFEPDVRPHLARFGPREPLPPTSYDALLVGSAGDVSWDLVTTPADHRTLWTFPRWSWQREALPAAQVVPRPTARYHGTVRVGGREITLRDAQGADARIYGHGNARSWAWLHADLGDGEACEIVAAVSMRPGLDRLPPLPLVAFRLRGGDAPRDGLLAAPLLRARLGRDRWRVRGRLGLRRLAVDVRLPEQETVEVDYRDPDGAALLCRNSLRAEADIRLGDRRWTLERTAHSEIGGFRPTHR